MVYHMSKKIPVVCTMGGLKDFAFTQSMTELSSVKVPTLTLGHPVLRYRVVHVVRQLGWVNLDL